MAAGIVMAGDIFDAIKSGDLAQVKKLFSENPEIINDENSDGEIPFFYAAKNGKKEIVEFFLAKDADINAILLCIDNCMKNSVKIQTMIKCFLVFS